ncbi:STAS domain-containing protein [Streptomyces sp. NPDC093260]|uniref:STAS domain-containing protein n=1 Tax=Streptomyces sp. NPDC093260 TaxID=3155073 RepID=UPI003423246A
MSCNQAVTPALDHDRSEDAVPHAGERAPDGPGVIQYEWRGVWVVVAQGSYDMQSVAPLANALDTAAGRCSKVVLDVSGVTFADSSFLNVLIQAHQATTLRVVSPPQQLRRLCEITGVDAVLETRPTVDAAVLS